MSKLKKKPDKGLKTFKSGGKKTKDPTSVSGQKAKPSSWQCNASHTNFPK